MTTVVNNPPANDNSGGPIGLIIGIIVLIVLLYLGYIYALPMLRQTQFGSPQINIPSKIDVNVNQTE